jgi:CubicO group peptidase (beta-lactamase class C family)
MSTDDAAYRRAASVALAAALILVAVVVLVSDGDPELMSLSTLPLIIIGAIAYTVANTHGTAYRAAVGVALAAAFILFWMIGAVGLMGTGDDHPADVMYVLVPVVGSIGATIARFQPHGMSRAMIAAALAQMLVPVIVVIARLNLVPISTSELISFTLILNGPFAALYLGSAWLFRKAARDGRVGGSLPRGLSTALAGLLVLSHTAAAAQAGDRYPAERWSRYATPEEAGFSSAGIASARAYADSVGAPIGMLIHGGAVVTSWGDVTQPAGIASASKALQGTLVGIAVGRGQMDLNATLAASGVDDRPPLTDAEKRARVRDLLTMRSGVYHSAASEAHRRPLPERGRDSPGTVFFYHNWNVNALNAMYERATGSTFQAAFGRDLAEPVGMEDFDPGHVYYTESPLQSSLRHPVVMLSARDMARVGLLYLRDGRWRSGQVVPAEWVRQSRQHHVPVGPNHFGYLLWIPNEPSLARLDAFTLAGNGNVIYVVPGADAVYVHRHHYLHDGPQGAQIREILLRLLAARTGQAAADPELVVFTPPET